MKGEKGIKIIAPTPFKKKIEQEKRDPDTNLPVLDADGKVCLLYTSDCCGCEGCPYAACEDDEDEADNEADGIDDFAETMAELSSHIHSIFGDSVSVHIIVAVSYTHLPDDFFLHLR